METFDLKQWHTDLNAKRKELLDRTADDSGLGLWTVDAAAEYLMFVFEHGVKVGAPRETIAAAIRHDTNYNGKIQKLVRDGRARKGAGRSLPDATGLW